MQAREIVYCDGTQGDKDCNRSAFDTPEGLSSQGWKLHRGGAAFNLCPACVKDFEKRRAEKQAKAAEG